MPVKLQLKNSTVKNRQPDPSSLDYGELCVSHHADTPALYFKDTTGALVQIAPDASVNSGPNPPSTGNNTGDLFWDGNNLLVWDGSAWLIAGARQLDELTDVTLTDPEDGEVLAFSGGAWVNVSAASISIDVDLGYTPAADKGTVTNSAGDDATIPLANGTSAGLSLNDYSDAEKLKLFGIEDGANVNVNADWNASSGDAEILNKPTLFSGDYDDLTNKPDIPEELSDLNDVDTSGATSGQLLRYNGSSWEPGSPGAVSVDLGYTPAADKGTVTNDAGSNAEIPLANGTNAGLSLNDYSAVDKAKLDAIPDTFPDGTVTSVDSGNGLTGGPITEAGTLSVQADGDTITVGAAGIKVTDGKFAEPGDIPDVSNYLPLAGGEMSGSVTTLEQTVTSIGFDLSAGPFWLIPGGIDVPDPTNAVAGMSGLIRFTAAPTSWGSAFQFAGGTPVSPSKLPAVSPFYVQASGSVYVGPAVEELI